MVKIELSSGRRCEKRKKDQGVKVRGNEEEPGEETEGATGRGEGSSAGETTWQELSKDQTVAVQLRMRSVPAATEGNFCCQ